MVRWLPPTREHRNGRIVRYDAQLRRKSDGSVAAENTANITAGSNVDEGARVVFGGKRVFIIKILI